MSFLKYQHLVERNKRELLKFVKGSGFFTRKRKLGLVHTIGHILFLVAQRNLNGYAITSQNYAALGAIERGSVCRSALCEARKKIEPEAFEFLLNELRFENASESERWKGHNVHALDATYLTLPASPEILAKFPRRPVEESRTHYPKGMLVTAMNLFTGQPVKASMDNYRGSERSSLLRMLDEFKEGDVLVLDRGYEGIGVWREVAKRKLFFACRVKACGPGLRKEVRAFIASQKKAVTVWLQNDQEEPLKLRLIRGKVDREGNPIILATNLFGREKYKPKEIYLLYLRRWKIETMYYRAKELLKMESFHARSVKGILQEIWANLILISITALATLEAKRREARPLHFPNFKAASEVIRRNFFFFIARRDRPVAERERAAQMLEDIGKILCVQQPGRRNPRVSKQPHSSWVGGEKNKLIDKYRARTYGKGKAA